MQKTFQNLRHSSRIFGLTKSYFWTVSYVLEPSWWGSGITISDLSSCADWFYLQLLGNEKVTKQTSWYKPHGVSLDLKYHRWKISAEQSSSLWHLKILLSSTGCLLLAYCLGAYSVTLWRSLGIPLFKPIINRCKKYNLLKQHCPLTPLPSNIWHKISLTSIKTNTCNFTPIFQPQRANNGKNIYFQLYRLYSEQINYPTSPENITPITLVGLVTSRMSVLTRQTQSPLLTSLTWPPPTPYWTLEVYCLNIVSIHKCFLFMRTYKQFC